MAARRDKAIGLIVSWDDFKEPQMDQARDAGISAVAIFAAEGPVAPHVGHPPADYLGKLRARFEVGGWQFVSGPHDPYQSAEAVNGVCGAFGLSFLIVNDEPHIDGSIFRPCRYQIRRSEVEPLRWLSEWLNPASGTSPIVWDAYKPHHCIGGISRLQIQSYIGEGQAPPVQQSFAAYQRGFDPKITRPMIKLENSNVQENIRLIRDNAYSNVAGVGMATGPGFSLYAIERVSPLQYAALKAAIRTTNQPIALL